jgi:hypothetical protein
MPKPATAKNTITKKHGLLLALENALAIANAMACVPVLLASALVLPAKYYS